MAVVIFNKTSLTIKYVKGTADAHLTKFLLLDVADPLDVYEQLSSKVTN